MVKSTRKTLFLSFVIPICFMLIMYAFVGIFPFGPKTVVSGDMLNQYVAITSFFKRAFWHPSMLLYTAQSGMGLNAWPMFAYYGTSPFILLAVIFPTKYLPIYFEVNILLSTGLISLSTCYLLLSSKLIHRYNKSMMVASYYYPLMFSILFSLSGYITRYSECTMWLNAIILFPITLLGWEKVVLNEQGGWLYLISLTGLIFVNYYIGVIVLEYLFLISICWVIYKLLKRQFNFYNFKIALKLLGLTVLSILNNLLLLLPSYIAQKQVLQAKFTPSLHKMMPLSELIVNFIPVREGLPLMYAGITVTFLAISYIFISVERREKVIILALVTVLLLSTLIQALYMAWHSFTMPNGFPQREAFVITLTLVMIAYRALLIIDTQQLNNSFLRLLIVGMILLLLELMLIVKIKDISWPNVIAIVTLVVANLLVIYKAIHNKRFSSLLMFIAILDLVPMSYVSYNSLSKQSLSWRPFAHYVSATESSINKISKKGISHYRLATNSSFNMNDPLLFGYNSVSGYVSQLPTEETSYISQLGYYQKHQWYRWSDYNNGSTLSFNRLLGFRYYLTLKNKHLLSDRGSKNDFLVYNDVAKFTPLSSKNNDNFIISTDRHAATLIVPANKKILKDQKVNYNPGSNPFVYFNHLFSEVTGKHSVYKTLSSPLLQSKKNVVSYDVTSRGGLVYCYLPTNPDDALHDLKIYVNGKHISNAYGKNEEAEDGIICLGKFPNNKNIKVDLRTNNAGQLSRPVFVSEQTPYFGNSNSIINLHMKPNKISWETSKSNQKSTMLVTLAYDQGWHVKVDGHSTMVYRAAGNLMGIKLPSKGYHQIQMTYRPPKWRLGVIISSVSLVCSIAMIIIDIKKTKKTIH